MLYKEPKKIWKNLVDNRTPYADGSMFTCPSMKSLFSNLYSIDAAISDTINLPDLESIYDDGSLGDEGQNLQPLVNTGARVSALVGRPSSINGYVNLEYNMSWHFFASEPVLARQTAPYFPPITPAPGVALSAGQLDIGQWFRPINIEYLVPIGTKTLQFNEGEPYFYLELFTDKKVVFKRFVLTEALRKLSEEATQAPFRYGKYFPLAKKYQMAKEGKLIEQIKAEIFANLVE
jgi:hypothetical protein